MKISQNMYRIVYLFILTFQGSVQYKIKQQELGL